MQDTEYEAAWKEGEDADKGDAPATEAVKAAKKAAEDETQGEYIRAYAELDVEKKDEEKSDDSKKDVKDEDK
jgi:hypothetical protein